MNIYLFNKIIVLLYAISFLHKFVYIFISAFIKDKKYLDDKKNKYAVLIAARNEEGVIASLIKSIRAQNYPKEYVDIYVGADNCSDSTAKVARELGAIVYERNNLKQIGKGYVLNFLLNKIKASGKNYDGYIVFDADNLVDSNFIKEINKVYNAGYLAATSYRNSTNFGSSLLSSGYALWFIHESTHLNYARMKLGLTCSINGTGFMFSQKLLDKYNGWNFFLLTEDIEFSINNMINKIKVGYANDAIIYDEQPTNLKQSFYQRLRWSKGYLEVFKKYGTRLLKEVFKGNLSCIDMVMNYGPSAFIVLTSLIVNIIVIIIALFNNGPINQILLSFIFTIIYFYLVLFILCLCTIIHQWKRIYCSPLKKILSVFSCPIFVLSFIPIAIIATFKKTSWASISHNSHLTVEEIKHK